MCTGQINLKRVFCVWFNRITTIACVRWDPKVVISIIVCPLSMEQQTHTTSNVATANHDSSNQQELY